MHAPDWLIHLLDPWKELSSSSKAIDTLTVFIHLTALLFGGGTAIVADRATLRVRDIAGEEGRRALLGIRASHRLVLIALCFSLASGIALAAADLDTFLASPLFGIKLLFVILLVMNGAVLTSTEARLDAAGGDAAQAERLWHRLRASSRASLVLWTGTVLAGTALANMDE